MLSIDEPLTTRALFLVDFQNHGEEMTNDAFEVITSVDAKAVTFEFGVLQDDGSCAVRVVEGDHVSSIGILSDNERRRLIGALRGDYTVWFESGHAFQAALEAYHRDQDLDVYDGSGREHLRRGLAAAIAAYNLEKAGSTSREE